MEAVPPMPAEASLRFAVLGELAMGGMGRVDLARLLGEEGGRIVAVKRLHAHLARDADFVGMFFDEVWLTGALHHPNVVELVGWGSDEEGLFLATEFVNGAPLGTIARAGRAAGEPMPEEVVAHVAARVAEGLAAAHELRGPDGRLLGIVHRDVTPSNVLVGFDGSVKVTDFGVAKAAGSTAHTATGVLKGKVAYMSPEYACGREVDRRSDLWSLGIVMFEVLAGTRPFAAAHDLELLRMVAEAPTPAMGTAVPTMDGTLARIVDRLLSRDAEARPADGHEAAALLDAWLMARGHDRASVERSLAAYADRHAADRKTEIVRLVGLRGEMPGSRRVRRPREAPPPEEKGSHVLTIRTSRPDPRPHVLRTSERPPPARPPIESVHTRRLESPEEAAADAAPTAPRSREVTATTRVAWSGRRTAGIVAVGAVAAVASFALFALGRRAGKPAAGETDGRVVEVPGAASAANADEPRPTSSASSTATSNSNSNSTATATATATSTSNSTSTSTGTGTAAGRRGAPKPPTPATVTKPAARSCTPHDFDYPTCLSRPR